MYADLNGHKKACLIMLFVLIKLAVLLKRDTSKCSAVIQLLLDKNVITADYDDICEHVGGVNDF